ncbi:phage tail protein [Halomonas litopenaei]|uniref:Phage tail protein n=1 Tax=Halomonas litopenaei TaxID=2109328 RepID=A0ABX5IVP8_9GAMM|nr:MULTISPECIES: phage tail protein [Halomonas]PTL88866.1 phage tail protein [Halomonas sp. SYSU XM8]PTL93429.1 phage tail protein [Halomonas litopenaei]
MEIDVLPDVCASYSPGVSPAFSVDTVQFGDGYQQRRPTGLNSVRETWNVSFNNLSQDDYELVYGFLKSRQGVHAFLWQPPWEYAAKRWVCTDLTSTRPSNFQVASIQATFVEDFGL